MTAATIPRSRLIRYTAEQITAHRAVATGLCIAGALPLQLISKHTYRAYDEEGNNPSFRTVEHNPTKLRKSGYWLRWKTAASIYRLVCRIHSLARTSWPLAANTAATSYKFIVTKKALVNLNITWS